MSKRLKFFILFFAIITIGFSYVYAVLYYAESNSRRLANTGFSLLQHEEVARVLEISEFNGLLSYTVATIELIDGRNVTYFIRDNQVMTYMFEEGLISPEVAHTRAVNHIGTSEVLNVQLGRVAHDIIYEVQLERDDYIYFVIVDGTDGAILMDFRMER